MAITNERPIFIVSSPRSGSTLLRLILDAHPRLTKDAIQAALDFAAKALKADVVYPLAESA